MRWLKRIGVVVASVLLVAVGAFVLSRWLGPTDGQERALAVMTADRAPPVGRNAFTGLWLMPYDVPVGRLDEVMARDLREFEGVDGAARGGFASTAADRFADVRDSGHWPPLCGSDAAECLRQVSAGRGEYARWRESHAALVARAALEGAGHYANVFAPGPAQPMPPFALAMRVRRTSHALDFVEGRRRAAFDGVCQDIATWRRLGAHNDSLLADSVAAAAVESSGRLFAHMLARAPAGQPLPDSCGPALAVPTLPELSPCDVMRGEFAYLQAAMAQPASLAYDPRMTVARTAVALAQACTPAMEQAVALDRPLPPPVRLPRFGFECIGNLAGCTLADIAAPAFRSYLVRMQEHGARLRLLSTLYWLHANPGAGRPLAQRLAERPVALRSPGHPVEVVQDGAALRIATPSHGEPHWQLPLNPALR